MSITFQPTRLVGAIAIAMGFSSPVFAQDQTTTLDPIIVTASKTAKKVSDVPARITVIDEKTIDQSPIADLPSLLAREAAANVVQLGGYGQQTSIFLRGTNSNQTLVLRDGVRLNTATTGAASLPFLDTKDLQRIEILKGPASVLYGTDAIGGVVQLISKTPEKTSAFVTGEMGEHNTYKAIVGADLAENGFYAQIRGQRLETDGNIIKDVANAERAPYDQKGYSAKVGYDSNLVAISVDFSQNEGNSIYDNFGTMTSQDFKNQSINLKGRVSINEQFAVHARLSQFKDDLDQVDSPSFVHSTTEEAELYTVYNLAKHQDILVGATFRNTDAKTDSIKEDVDSTGYYIQHQYNAHGFNTQVGVRVEDNEKFGTHTVAQGGIRYQLLPLTSIYTNIGSAFKAPTFNDMYGWGGNPDLKPEKSISYEIGVDQKFNYGVSAGLSAFVTEVDDLINSDPVTYQMVNIDKAKIEGAESYIKWQGDNLYLDLGYQYVRAKDKKNNEDLSRRPRQSASLTAGWADATYGISTTVIAKSDSDNSGYDAVQIPGFTRIDFNAHYNVNPYIKLFTNIQNIGDKQYRTAFGSGSYYINDGRQASAGVTFRY
ncbi:TonB-dependent receptor [Acinetobacter sp. NIPH 2699]|uniref:TonB-dependent receptor plug domain-containing protein n=1 Tax=Acinetobacter sp. NIPH 2699 TaxID=2923433 RepID=UPI001F4B4190|nr:TonB-dependent receptor [Acinetobacter sp. NIPH 2699]MCH7336522.1 TonB-dependent receptor [Acinetobacter sp. NIPH 2699]